MWTRIRLAGYSLLTSWLINTAAEFVCRLVWGSSPYFPGLSLFTGPVYLITFVLFAIPLAASSRAAWQLRFWYLPLLASLVWATLLTGLIFHASIREMLGPWPSQAVLLWLNECALSSIVFYLLLLRSAVRKSRPA